MSSTTIAGHIRVWAIEHRQGFIRNDKGRLPLRSPESEEHDPSEVNLLQVKNGLDNGVHFTSPIARQFMSLERKIFVENAYQLTLDLQSYNDNNKFGATLEPIDWNVGRDIEERGMSDEYNPDISEDPYGDEDE